MDEIETDPTLITIGSIIAIADFYDQNAYWFSDGFLKTAVSLKNLQYKPATYFYLVINSSNSLNEGGL
jgi:hypothetical protein